MEKVEEWRKGKKKKTQRGGSSNKEQMARD